MYLTPLPQPKGRFGTQKFQWNTILLVKQSEMMKEAGFEGHYTNHSLRVTSATRLFDAEVDESPVLKECGHLKLQDWSGESPVLKECDHLKL